MRNKKLIVDTISMLLCALFALIAYLSNNSASIVFWLLAFVIGARAKAIEGVMLTLENKSLNVEFLMILSALGAFAIQDYPEGVILILIFGISGVLEEYTMSKSEKELSNLLNLTPKKAIIIKDQQQVEINAMDVMAGDILLVRVGDMVAADGVIISGVSSFNQAAITGEFASVSKQIGDSVLSGSINEDALVQIRVSTDAANSTVQKIVNFVADAQNNKNKVENDIDRFEKYYVYFVLVGALLMYFIPTIFNLLSIKEAFYRAIVLLVVASPCAVVASITPTMLATLSAMAKRGILVKGSSPIETLSKVSAIVLDKTGTVTFGLPQVLDIVLDDSVDDQQVLSILLCAEQNSTHPLANAITEFLKPKLLYNSCEFILETNEKAGYGIEIKTATSTYAIGRFHHNHNQKLRQAIDLVISQGYSVVEISQDQHLIGYVKLMDTIRPDSKETVNQLKKMNIGVSLFTGDNQQSAEMVGKLTGITDVIGNCFPNDKADKVLSLQKQGHIVAMLGDGINDSPAIAIADVGLAMGRGSGVALESADVVFMNDSFSHLAEVIKLSKKAVSLTRQNIVFSLIIILFLVLMNVLQVITLPIGVVFHEGSTILVILNGLRMLRQ